MKCRGNFKFKGLEKKDGGEFTNERGQVIKFDSKYAISLDEITPEGKALTRIFKVDLKSPVVAQFSQLKLYDDVTVEFEVSLYTNGSKVIPVALVK